MSAVVGAFTAVGLRFLDKQSQGILVLPLCRAKLYKLQHGTELVFKEVKPAVEPQNSGE